MPQDTDSSPVSNTLQCPTCRAVQAWSDTCRRCKSDLRLLREFAKAYERDRRRCLEQLAAGLPQAARVFAERCYNLRPDADSLRLLALTALCCGDWAEAETLARRIPK